MNTSNKEDATSVFERPLQEGYLEDFRFIVITGMCCGLDHPIEWAANAWRTPGGTLSLEYYKRMQLSVPRFLLEVYEGLVGGPVTTDLVIAWGNKHFENNEMFVGFFDIFRPGFDHLIGSKGTTNEAASAPEPS